MFDPALNQTRVSKPASLLVLLGKAFSGIPDFGVVGTWLVTPEQVRYNVLVAFSS